MAVTPFRIASGPGGLVGRARAMPAGRSLRRALEPGPLVQRGSSDLQPFGVSGLVLWLSADVGVTTLGDQVQAWSDRSIEGNDAALQGAAPTIRVNEQNGLPMIAFNASSRMTLGAPQDLDFDPTENDTFEIIALIKNPVGLSGTFLSKRDQFSFGYGGAGPSLEGVYGGLSNDLVGTDIEAGASVVSMRSGDPAGTIRIRQGVTDSGSSPFGGVTDPLADVVIGDSGEFLLGELIVFDRTLNSFEREAVEDYLMLKWLVSLLPPPTRPPVTLLLTVDATDITVDSSVVTVDQTER